MHGFTAGYNKAMKEQKPAQHLPKEKVFDIMRNLTALSYSERIPINSDEYRWILKITEDVRSLLDYPIEPKPADGKEYSSPECGTTAGVWSEEEDEEPVPKGYDEAYLNEKIAKASKTWEGVDVDKYIDEVRGREPDKSLEKAAENYIAPIENDEGLDYINFNGRDIKDAFIAGAKWQEEKDEARIKQAHDWGFGAGSEWQKQQMLKDTEECELYWDGDFLAIDLNMRALGYSERDKVKVIVLKAEEE